MPDEPADEFEWNEGKCSRNIAKHGIDFDDARLIWRGPVLEKVSSRAANGGCCRLGCWTAASSRSPGRGAVGDDG